jgi:hypothetical protein
MMILCEWNRVATQNDIVFEKESCLTNVYYFCIACLLSQYKNSLQNNFPSSNENKKTGLAACVGFMLYKVVTGQCSVQTLRLSSVTVVPQTVHTRILFIFHRRFVIIF